MILANDTKTDVSESELAHLGEGEVGYIRQMRSEDITERFPGAPELDPGQELWALFSADGTPILVSDDRTSAFHKAQENDLYTVSLH
ncbi:BQ00720 family protein [Pararhizobium mangrovi]|uniref:DUF1150 family protein n=1 Tax=Pararhizobium mangrovi TaxID=2590452 RepID=A0A506U5L4_9HYPH|nr:DUF1150 family protein [Pararhizobium mangrovi]TPW28411.1 DUF1150 family protein [Pararhizobium mangrovi]